MRTSSSSRLDESQRRYREILEAAAKLIFRRGYEATSMQEISAEAGLTKAGLYHYVATKEALLLDIMHYGMDLFEEQVLTPAQLVEDPVERIRVVMARNLALITHGAAKEVTIILHEHQTLTGEAQAQINARKKKYVRFLETAVREATAVGKVRPIDPTLAAFGLLGMVLWTYKWFQPGGALSPEQLSEGMLELFFQGLLVRP